MARVLSLGAVVAGLLVLMFFGWNIMNQARNVPPDVLSSGSPAAPPATSVPIAPPSSTTAPSTIVSGHFKRAFMCRGVNDKGEPVGETDRYSPNEKFTVAIQYADLPDGDNILATLSKDGSVLKNLRAVPAPDSREGYITLTFSAGDPWPPGPYLIEVFYQSNKVASLPFHVADGTP